MTRGFVRHPVGTWMLFAAFVVLAIYAVPRIQVEAIPVVELPSLTVVTAWPGASPKAIQRSITLPVEEAVRNVHGVESVKSTSRAGRSLVEVEFRREVDLEFARLDVNEQLGAVRRTLPLNASQPQILPYVPEDFRTEQFFTFSIESTLAPNELRERAEQYVVPQVLAVAGVADAQVMGGARPLLKILLDRERLDRYDITADEVFRRIDSLDALSAAGYVRGDGMDRILSLRDPVDLERIRSAVLARRGARSFTLADLGELRPDFEDPTHFVRNDGRNVVQVQVDKRSGANSVAVSRDLRKALPAIEKRTPIDASFTIDQDEGERLEEKLEELVGRSLVILLMLFGLLAITLRQFKLTAVVIASIVFAIVICLSLFYFLDLSVNFITISGLTICFGMLLDNSILVLDSIHRRIEGLARADEAGLSRRAKLAVARETIIAGTGEVMFPILATTATTIVAFLSFIFLSGRLALYYVPLAISVGTAMFASIFVAFGWIPVVLEQVWARPLVQRSPDGPREVEDPTKLAVYVEDVPDLTSKTGWFETLFNWNQRLWWLVLPVVLWLMFWGHDVYETKVIKGGFWQMPDQEKLVFFMRMPEGTDVRVTSETMLAFEQKLMPIADGAKMRANVFGHQAYMEVEFDDDLLQSGIPMLYRLRLTEQADATGGTAIFISGFAETPYFKGNMRGSTGNSLMKLTGYNSKRLTELADFNLARVENNRRVRKARIAGAGRFGPSSTEETVIELDRDRLAEHGLSALEIVAHLRRLLGVDSPWEMLLDGEERRVQLSFRDAETIEFSDVAGQVIRNSAGEMVRLGDLVTTTRVPLSNEIVREDQRYTMLVNWEYVGTERMRTDYMKQLLDSADMPYGYSAEESTQQFFSEEEESDLKFMTYLAAGFILMVMMALFESFFLPWLILTSLPLALLGVVVVFWKSTSTFDSSAQIGLVLLFGVVVNNAILLVSRFRTEARLILKAKLGGEPTHEVALFPGQPGSIAGSDLWYVPREERRPLLRRAVARATMVRLRSILLTSGTTIVSLLPLLVQVEWKEWAPSWLGGIELPVTLSFMQSDNQDIWQNLALTSIGGLLSSTILIILTIPALYYFVTSFVWWIRTEIHDLYAPVGVD